MVGRLLRGVALLQHRGCAPTKLTAALAEALGQGQGQEADTKTEKATTTEEKADTKTEKATATEEKADATEEADKKTEKASTAEEKDDAKTEADARTEKAIATEEKAFCDGARGQQDVLQRGLEPDGQEAHDHSHAKGSKDGPQLFLFCHRQFLKCGTLSVKEKGNQQVQR